MARKKTSKSVKNRKPAETKQMRLFNEEAVARNDLSSLFGGFMQQNPFQVGFGTPGTAQVSAVDTLMVNQRWYLVSNMRQLISQCYVEIGLIQRVVDVPVNDAFRGGVEIQTKQLDEEEIQYLTAYMRKEKDLKTAAQAMKWNRLFGGGGILTINGDADLSQPFSITNVKQGDLLSFRALDLWELFWSKQNTSDYAAIMDGPDMIQQEFYDYYGHKTHNSRVMSLVGIEAPSFVRPRLRGWGLSMLETLIRSMNQYLKTVDVTFEIIDEAKIDVYKIKNFASALMSASGESALHKRLSIANREKNYQHAITMDSEDDYQQKQISFTGLADTMSEIRNQIAADVGMPQAKLFGFAAKGFNSGEDDIENYNAIVESEVREKAHFHVTNMIELRCAQLFGHIPTDLSITFKPLRVLSAEQEENVKTQKMNRLVAAKQAFAITDEEFRDACNRDNLLPVKLEEGVELPKPDDDSGDDGGDDE